MKKKEIPTQKRHRYKEKIKKMNNEDKNCEVSLEYGRLPNQILN